MLLTIFIVQLVGLISPGPDFFYVARRAASSNTRNALFGVVGISLGIAFWVVVALFGLAFIGKSAQAVQFVIMILGGSFLAYSGSKMLRVRENAQFTREGNVLAESAWKEVMKGLAVNISNAKAAVFFSSVLAGYVANLSQLADFFWVFVILVGSTFVYFALIALIFSRAAVQHFYARYSRYLDNGAGLVFLFFGLRLIIEGVSGLI